MKDEQPLLPWFVADEAKQQEKKIASEGSNQFKEHLRTMRMCWPEWHGPKICDGVDGRISVHSTVVSNETHGATGFHYMEPCRIIEIGPRFKWIRAVIDFDSDAPEHCRDSNGEILKLDFDEIWPPTDDLWEIRNRNNNYA